MVPFHSIAVIRYLSSVKRHPAPNPTKNYEILGLLEIQRIIRRAGQRRELASRQKNYYSRRMAKKTSGAIGGVSSTSPQSEKPAEKSGIRITRPSETRKKPVTTLFRRTSSGECRNLMTSRS
jgi:hypothetical protein